MRTNNTFENFERSLLDIITTRIKSILFKNPELTGTFYIAGGCLTGIINDVDIYPVNGIFQYPVDSKLIFKSKNANSYQGSSNILQYCNYKKDSLQELVESFDYAHIKIGAKISKHSIEEIYISPDFVIAKVTDQSFYTGSEYPFSSLIRILKYYKRDSLNNKSAIKAIILILNDIVKRGFTGYDDFRDQMDAIDLGMLPEEMKDCDRTELMELFNLLNRTGE